MKNKKNSLSTILTALFLSALLFLILTDTENSLKLCQNTANLWWNNILPTLLPFMIISRCIVDSSISEIIGNFLGLILKPVFRISSNCIYIMIVGLLCGFPMGSIAIHNCLKQNKITQNEANYLLFFCNNLSPAFVISFVFMQCPFLDIKKIVFIQYGIPLLLAMLLRYSYFRNKLTSKQTEKKERNPNHKNLSILMILPNAIKDSISSILLLLGTMMIFSIIQLPLYNSNYTIPFTIKVLMSGLLEITSAVNIASAYGSLYPIVYGIILPFGGLSCMCQSYFILNNDCLSFKAYILGKIAHLTIGILLLL